MFKMLVEKELKSIINGPKFIATFSICFILILLSIFVGIQDYRAAVKQYESGLHLTQQEMEEEASWRAFNTRVFRKPDPMQIFVSGINNDIGRFSLIHAAEPVRLVHSIYSDDPIFAVFRFIDLNFIFLVVLSLFAILFTYDAINGEREMGTLKLTFANPIPRVKYILAKFIGSWLGLVVPLIIPFLLGLLIVLVHGIPITGDHWMKLLFFFIASLAYFTFFIILGLFISAVTKRSAVSFLLLLVAWVVIVLILPRVSVMTAGKLVPVPSIAEVDGQIDRYSKSSWNQYIGNMEERLGKRNEEMQGMNREEREAYRDARLWEWMEEDDAARSARQKEINRMSRLLVDELRLRKEAQQRLAFSMSRLSPASAYQLAAMNLAGTDIGLKERYVAALDKYHDMFTEYTDKKKKESGGGGGGIRIEVSSEHGFSFNVGQDRGALNSDDMPLFQEPALSLRELITRSMIDFGLMLFWGILGLAGTFVAFLRYDVR